jgi:hypothetical protein
LQQFTRGRIAINYTLETMCIERNTAVNTRLITTAEIVAKQQTISNDFRRCQTTFSVAGVRRLVGNTIIAMGEHVYGRIEECRETAGVAPKAAPARGI